MTRQEKATAIVKILDEFYPVVPIPLEHSNPYTLLIAVLLSAQCTDVRVNKVTPHLFALADNPWEMAQLPVESIEEVIRSCGLAPRKSRAISELSKILNTRFEGSVPADFDDLESLPGVGHKTASVVMSQAFGIPAFPVDTHIHRLAFRWGLSTGKNVVKTEQDLKRIFSKNSWNRLHLQIIYFGRDYCPARGHDFKSCPICSIYGRKSLIK